MTPDFQPNVDLVQLALFAGLNPAVVGVSFWMGRQADQPAKLLVAAFAGAVAGIALLWLLALVRVPLVAEVGRAAAGLFAASLIIGGVYAGIGYLTRKRPLSRSE